MKAPPPSRISRGDVLAGVSVALVLIPQGMAYAELAGLPGYHGLYASALPLIAAAFFASSPYLQTGPVALSALLTFGALSPMAAAGTQEFVALAALLAIAVGVSRILIGVLRAGWLMYLISRPMMSGFLSGAVILIIASQLPGALGVAPPEGGVLASAWWSLSHPGGWEPASVGLTLTTIAIVVGGKRIHPLLPGVLVATIVGIVYSVTTAYAGRTVGALPAGLPPIGLDLPWRRFPELLVPGVVIALIGFADAASIARVYASEARQQWDADREFLGSGLANVVAGLFSGLPLGGSLARTSINRLAGARSRWSGLVTGVAVLIFLPFSGLLAPLPRAVLSGIVIAAVTGVMRPRELVAVWRASKPQTIVAWGTLGLTLVLSPRIDHAVLLGVLMASAVHLWGELRPGIDARRDGDTLHVEPRGVLWFGSAPALEERVFECLAEERDLARVVVDCRGLGRIDLSGAYTLAEIVGQGRRTGIDVTLEAVPDHAMRVLRAAGLADRIGPRGSASGVTPGTPAAPAS